MRQIASAFALATICANGVHAATLKAASGEVFVNTGSGFQTAVEGQSLRSGDRVMIGRSGGHAVIAYDHACEHRVETGNLVTVDAGNPCGNAHGQTSAVQPGSVVGGGAVGVAAGVGAAAAIGIGLGVNSAKKSRSPASN